MDKDWLMQHKLFPVGPNGLDSMAMLMNAKHYGTLAINASNLRMVNHAQTLAEYAARYASAYIENEA